jgi:hypothetical protein
MGEFSLKGFSKPQQIFARSLIEIEPEKYLAPLLNAVNQTAPKLDGYRSIGRKFTVGFIRDFGNGKARPFLARELLNIAKLRYSLEEVCDLAIKIGISELSNQCVGYFVEWEGTFDGYERDEDIKVAVRTQPGAFFSKLYLRLPSNALEVIRQIEKGQPLRVRGVIEQIFLFITINYVDLEFLPMPAAT